MKQLSLPTKRNKATQFGSINKYVINVFRREDISKTNAKHFFELT